MENKKCIDCKFWRGRCANKKLSYFFKSNRLALSSGCDFIEY
jgi:hypothetical protein